VPRDGGLATWRSGQAGPEKEVPAILFPINDLLLLGHTKRMHLFEPRWVNMIDTARRIHGGVIGLLYFSPDGDVVDVVTIAEVISVGNLGNAGRMVVVRGAGRARLRGLSPAVVAPDQSGVALVEELPELLREDLKADSEGGPAAAEVAAAELGSIVQELDLSGPVEPAAASEAAGEEGEAEASGGAGPELWTHERASAAEDFAALAGTAWERQWERVRRTLAGVPLAPPSGELELFGLAATNLEAAPPGCKAAVAALYAALGAASLPTRLELFTGRGQSLTQRLRALAEQVRELQGMARARRALAGVFGGDEAGS